MERDFLSVLFIDLEIKKKLKKNNVELDLGCFSNMQFYAFFSTFICTFC